MFKKDICPCCLKPYNKRRHEQCPFCYGIDFDQIEEAYISFVEDRFHNEIEKTRTLVASYETGGTIHNHWEITPVIHHIYDGTFYTFYIKFKNGEKIKRILEKKNELCKRLCEIAKDLQAFDTEKRIQIANAFSDGFYMNVVEELALEYNNYEIENYFHEKMEEFIEKKMEYLLSCEFDQFVEYMKKVLICLLSTIQDGNIFTVTDNCDVQFVQVLEDGKYGFVLLQRENGLTKKEVKEYVYLKRRKGFKKIAVIFTSELEKEAYRYLEHSEILLWDVHCIESCLYKCYGKLIDGEFI